MEVKSQIHYCWFHDCFYPLFAQLKFKLKCGTCFGFQFIIVKCQTEYLPDMMPDRRITRTVRLVNLHFRLQGCHLASGRCWYYSFCKKLLKTGCQTRWHKTLKMEVIARKVFRRFLIITSGEARVKVDLAVSSPPRSISETLCTPSSTRLSSTWIKRRLGEWKS